MKRIALLLIPVLFFAQTYVLQKDVLSAGGREMTSTNYILNGTISQTTIGSVSSTNYEGVIGFWHPPEPFPPESPYIYATKSGNNVILTWNKITTDTLGNPETVHYYVVYRSTSPSFIPGSSDSIGGVTQPDTTYTDAAALGSSNSYYYLVKAVDVATNRSVKSNMGYKLNKIVNENSGATSDRNWVSLPWHNSYLTVQYLTNDLSPFGDPLNTVTNLRNDQAYESWLYDDLFGWYGADFSISSGHGFEMVTINDTIVRLVGSNNPSGLISLNENSGAVSDRNWVSIPYNAVYNTVSSISSEYSPAGNPLTVLTNMRDDQAYESWLYDDLFGWYGADFSIAIGRGYELITIADTTWNPTEYNNTIFDGDYIAAARRTKRVDIYPGNATETARRPLWCNANTGDLSGDAIDDQYNAAMYVAAIDRDITMPPREVGISHIVRAYYDAVDVSNIRFIAYRIPHENDILTEEMIGCGIVCDKTNGALWLNVGNFRKPWHNGDKVILIVEVEKDAKLYYAVKKIIIDQSCDIQDIGKITFHHLPEIKIVPGLSAVEWDQDDNNNIIGFSVYDVNKRLNSNILAGNRYENKQVTCVHPIVVGGFEIGVYTSQLANKSGNISQPYSYLFNAHPSHFNTVLDIEYALPKNQHVTIMIYDVSGRIVQTLVSQQENAGFYQVQWNGSDDNGRKAPSGVYFVQMRTDNYQQKKKIILVK